MVFITHEQSYFRSFMGRLLWICNSAALTDLAPLLNRRCYNQPPLPSNSLLGNLGGKTCAPKQFALGTGTILASFSDFC
jgi:hypothetical protein